MVIEYNDESSIQITLEDQTKTITIYSVVGPTSVSISQSSSVVYPDYTYTFKVYIDSEVDLTEDIEAITDWISSTSYAYWIIYLIDDDGEYKELSQEEIASYLTITYLSTSYDSENDKQTINFGIKFNPTTDTSLSYFVARFNVAGVNGTLYANTEFTLVPQKIDNINIKNYVTIDDELQQYNVIQPYSNGLISIDTVPTTGYYDYLVIKDVTGGSQLITFAQVDEDGNRLSSYDATTSDGLGIILTKLTDENGNALTTYVATAIDSSYDSITHTIQVSAYLSDGTLLATNYIEIDVRLLPGVELTYYQPSGSVEWTIDTATQTDYLAVGTSATFKATAKNSDGDISVSITSDDISDISSYYSVVSNTNGFYTLTYIGSTDNLSTFIGNTITLTFTTTSTIDTGMQETGSASVTFTFVYFVIYDVSVTTSRTTSSTNGQEVYGNYGQTVDFEFYFADTDISYNSSVYDTISSTIDSILEELNSGEYLKWYSEETSNWISTSALDSSQIKYDTENRTIVVYEGNTFTQFSIEFNLVLATDNSGSNLTGMYEIASYGTDSGEQFRKVYDLTFSLANTEFEPTVITSEEDFLDMSMGSESNYILAVDLVLENYTPMSLDVNTFDGNGHTITILSFAEFTSSDLQAGLFTEISSTTMVMNLQVEYQFGTISVADSTNSFKVSDYVQLDSDSYTYTSVSVGGLAVVNNGVITNCKVVGTFAVETPNLSVSNRSIEFYIGGLVTTNTGYITNSVSELSIAAMANVGGLVYENSGKIVSSYFNARDNGTNTADGDEGGLIYIYYGSQSTSVVKVEVGGFAVVNSGQILMSYVDVGTSSNSSGSQVLGNMSAKDESAGFVYSNSGTIQNCYVTMDQFGENSNTFSGFAISNSGTIDCCYTYINGGERSSNSASMFISSSGNTGEITDSYIVISNTESETVNNGIEGLSVVRRSSMYLQSSYSAFTFGDNSSAVWYTDNSLPKLVSTTEISPFTTSSGSYTTDSSGNLIYSSGFKTITLTLEIDDDGNESYVSSVDYSNYGTKTYPYLIYSVNSWNTYFTETNRSSYYRIVCDIDFDGTTPLSSAITFQGNIQGNCMDIEGIVLYTQESLDAIGLFAQMESVSGVVNSVRNLNIVDADIRATKTQAVGTLAGIISGFNLYNISVSSSSVILGNNAVGGLAGVIRGQFDVENIYSNVSVNASYDSNLTGYSVYLSINNGQTASYNLSDVSYAGSVFGIADGYYIYSSYNSEQRTTNTYYYIKNIVVDGEISIVAENAGGVIGLVGEMTYLQNVDVDITGYKISGYQYSAGIVAENRGIVDDANIVYTPTEGYDNLFNNSYTTAAGLVGLNLGGLVMNSSADIDITRSSTSGSVGIVAGIVGRNIDGSIYNVTYSGELLLANTNSLEITAGIVGAMYSSSTLTSYSSGLNNILSDCSSAIPSTTPIYYIDSSTNSISSSETDLTLSLSLENCSVAKSTITYWMNNLSYYYTYTNIESSNIYTDYDEALNASRILGIAIGVLDATSYNSIASSLNYGWSGDYLVVNGDYNIDMLAVFAGSMYNGANVVTSYVNVLDNSGLELDDYSINYMFYIYGQQVGSFDSWSTGLNGEKVLITSVNTNSDSLYQLTGHYYDDSNIRYVSINSSDFVVYANDSSIRYYTTITDYDIYLCFDIGYYSGYYYATSTDTEGTIIASNPSIYLSVDEENVILTIYNSSTIATATVIAEYSYTCTTLS